MDPNYELTRVVINRLKRDVSVSGFVAARVFDRVPAEPKPVFPYISMGPSDVLQDDAECIMGEEISFQIDCWSEGDGEAYGSAEVKKLAGVVKRCLHGAEVTVIDREPFERYRAEDSASGISLYPSVVMDFSTGLSLSPRETGNVTIDHRITRIMREPNGITNHAALSFRAFVEID
ncbi:MAG: hypothetical protein CML23_21750 [Rhizobiaceae bacterium]|nr:hypothetical protein [Rhizobiaceae bacterium]